ncbi:disulfide bond formation protein B [Aliishimia ponticola]|uniref:Disulfide bond formation protein B n=1 Tax=Aliishimia ponticola TaxID=2499833 RepID=A0A4S4NGJ1_9RHOB|nr:disulfide bond formation protein B [Aliishimia ponticola]THH38754.1 disulfide bond formation protein B [Aliishimia ponticola]
MTARRLILLATAGSAALLVGVFVFQSLGWAPCKMCLWQRWPHAAALLIGVLALMIGRLSERILAGLGALTVLIGAGIAAYHSGVERKWWDGPASCSGTGSGLGGLSASELIPGASDAPPLVLCDTLTPFLFGLTMANWNFIASLVLMVIWVAAAKRASA